MGGTAGNTVLKAVDINTNQEVVVGGSSSDSVLFASASPTYGVLISFINDLIFNVGLKWSKLFYTVSGSYSEIGSLKFSTTETTVLFATSGIQILGILNAADGELLAAKHFIVGGSPQYSFLNRQGLFSDGSTVSFAFSSPSKWYFIRFDFSTFGISIAESFGDAGSTINGMSYSPSRSKLYVYGMESQSGTGYPFAQAFDASTGITVSKIRANMAGRAFTAFRADENHATFVAGCINDIPGDRVRIYFYYEGSALPSTHKWLKTLISPNYCYDIVAEYPNVHFLIFQDYTAASLSYLYTFRTITNGLTFKDIRT